MKIPKKIKISCHKFEVKWREKLWDDSDNRGYFKPSKACIELAEDMPEQYKFEVFIHEVIEAIKWSYNLDIKHQDLIVLSMEIAQVIQSIEEEKCLKNKITT